MSLEAQLQANTTALLKLAAILEGGAISTVKDVNKDPTAKPAAPKAQAEANTPVKPQATLASIGKAIKSAVTYDDIKKAANALIVKHGRESFMKVLEGFQIKTAMEAKPEQFPALLEAIAKAAAVEKS